MMANEGELFTLWSNPMRHWTKILEEITVTQQMLQEADIAKETIDPQIVEDRLKPFRTIITESTLSQLVK